MAKKKKEEKDVYCFDLFKHGFSKKKMSLTTRALYIGLGALGTVFLDPALWMGTKMDKVIFGER